LLLGTAEGIRPVPTLLYAMAGGRAPPPRQFEHVGFPLRDSPVAVDAPWSFAARPPAASTASACTTGCESRQGQWHRLRRSGPEHKGGRATQVRVCFSGGAGLWARAE